MAATRRRANQPTNSVAPFLVLGSCCLAAVSSWYGLPPVVVFWACLLIIAWLEQPVVLTGRKDDHGYPSAANSAEEARLASWQRWRLLRTSLVPIPGIAPLAPGWPPLASFVAGVWAGLVAAWLPVVGDRYLAAADGRLLDAVSAFVVVVGVAEARRSVGPPDHPGTRLDSLVPTIRRSPGPMVARMAVGALVGLAVAIAWRTAARIDGARFGWRGLVAQLHLDPLLPHPGIGAPTAVLYPLLAGGGALLAIAGPWKATALATWTELCETRDAWAPRWAGLKLDPPLLIDHRTVGSATVDTFEGPPHMGAAAFLPLAQKLAPALGAGVAVAVLERPDDVGGSPAPGTVHPRRFDVVAWPVAELPDLTVEADPDVVQLAAHASMVWALEPLGYGRPVPLGLEPVSDDGSPKRVWASRWGWPGGPGLAVIRQAEAPGGGAMTAVFPPSFRCPVLVDDLADVVYFGAIGDEGAVLTPEHEGLGARFAELALDDRWTQIWETVLKRGAPKPLIEHGATTERSLASDTTVHRMAFSTRWGVDPTGFAGLEPKLATALSAAPFVSVMGWTQKGSGERHPQAFVVCWADEPVPTSPDDLAPSMAAPWVLAGQVNAAFDAASIARPEVAEARALTTPASRHHIWRVTLQLYGGVTSADVRSRSERLRRALKAGWLRVEDAPLGVVLYVGAEPGGVELKSGENGALRLSALDWGQAWQDSGVVGSNGDVPHLTRLGHLPRNRQVEVRDFILPPGVDRPRVKAVIGKIKATTGNSFVEVRESPDGAGAVRLLVSAQNPLPAMVPFDFAAADRVEGLAFATGVEGEPVAYDPVESPHLLAAGVTGAGKSALASALLYGAVAHGAELYVIDPVKGGADFVFLRDYARAFASDAVEAAAVMKAVYAEVSRRKNLNAAHGVGSFVDLPEDVRPRRIVVMVDEFTSLIGQDPVQKQPFDDPDDEAERQLQLAINLAKQQVGIYAGRLAREARSAGVTLVLGTQKLMAKTLDVLPGGSDLKTNLARILLGKASTGERMSALRSFDDAPVLDGDIPKGRGLWEPLTSSAVVIQAWYATQDEYLAELERRVPKLTPAERLDLTPYLARGDQPGAASSGAGPSARRPSPAEDVVVDLGEIELSLVDLEAESGPAAGEPDATDDGPAGVVPLPGPDWGGSGLVDAGAGAPAGDPRWAIDWGETTPDRGRDGRVGPAVAPPDSGTGSVDGSGPDAGDDEWGIVPVVRRRRPDEVAQDGSKAVVEDEF